VVGQDVLLPGGTADVRVLLFVKLADGGLLDAALRVRICAAIKAHASPRHVPAVIEQCDEIPYTANGKKVEVAVKRVLDGQPVSNLGAIANPGSLKRFEQLRAALTLTPPGA
jgi:acetoacetyl-CoA synthetase